MGRALQLDERRTDHPRDAESDAQPDQRTAREQYADPPLCGLHRLVAILGLLQCFGLAPREQRPYTVQGLVKEGRRLRAIEKQNRLIARAEIAREPEELGVL